MREFVRIRDTAPGGEDLLVNLEAVDCVATKDGATVLTLRSGRVVRADQRVDVENYFPWKR